MNELLEQPRTSVLFPLKLRDEVEVNDANEMADLVLLESDVQLEEKQLRNEEARGNYQFACDCLNTNRLIMRLLEEGCDAGERGAIVEAMIIRICSQRDYDPDDFRAGVEATRERARFPFGLKPLTLARNRALKKPITLKVPGLEKAKTAHLVASMAFHLQELVGNDRPIILPVEAIRKLLGVRKLVISGVIRLLTLNGILECTNSYYHTGRARHFRFVGQAGTHYETEEMKKMEKRIEEEIPF